MNSRLIALILQIFGILVALELPINALAANAAVAPVPITAVEFQKQIDKAIHNGEKTVTVPAGVYHLSQGLDVVGATGLTIKGAGAGKTTLIFQSLGGGITVQHSKNIVLSGFAIDFEPLPFTEGVISDVKHLGGNRWLVDFGVEPGFPPLTQDQSLHPYVYYYFDRDTKRELEQSVLSRGSVQVLSPESGRLFAAAKELKAGDYVVLKQQKLPRGFALRFIDASDITVDDVTIESSPGLAVAARYVGGDNHFSYKIAIGPTPPGARLPRLISTNADGMQWFWSPGSVTFDHCDFGDMGDDGIHIRAFAARIVAIDNPRSIVIVNPIAENLFAAPFGDFATKGAVSIESAGNRAMLGDVQVDKVAETAAPAPGLGGVEEHYERLLLKSALAPAAKVGDFVAFNNLNPIRYVIENSEFHHTRARGLLLQASNGEVTNDHFHDIGLSAIELRLDGSESCCHVENVTIEKSDIRHVAYGLTVGSFASDHLGAINVNDPGQNSGVVSHRHIVIDGNTVNGSGGAGIFVDSTQDLTVRNNNISNTNRDVNSDSGGKWGRAVDGAVTITHSKSNN